MGVVKSWSNASDMSFYYGGGSSLGTSQVGAYGDGKNFYCQILSFTTGSNGGVGFDFTWKPYKNTGDSTDLSVRCGISVNKEKGCFNDIDAGQGTVKYFGYKSSTSNNITWSDNDYVFLPKTTYYIYVNRPGGSYGWYNYNTGNSEEGFHYGSASMSFKKDLTYTLSINEGANSYITVNRTSSPNGSDGTGKLSNGATIYYNDVLNITFDANTGHNLDTHIVNGSTFTSGGSYTVSSNVSVVSTASVKYYTLSIEPDTGSTIIVNRFSSPLQNAATGILNNGDTIYYNDVLNITTSSSEIYEILEQLLNDNAFISGSSYSVTGNVLIITTTRMRGIAHIDNGEEVEMYLVYIYDDDGWSIYIPYIDNGSSWDICG